MCTLPQNVNSVLETRNTSQLTRRSEYDLTIYQHTFSYNLQSTRVTSSFLQCVSCTCQYINYKYLEGVFTENLIENTTFRCSTLRGRCELLIIVKSTEQFIES